MVRRDPRDAGCNHELFQALPELRFDRSMMLTQLIRAVENLSIHIVLNLVSGGISTANRRRVAVSGIIEILAFPWRIVAGNVIEHSRSLAAVNGIEYPFQKSFSFTGKTDAVEGVHGEGRITNPRITVIPVP